MRQVNSNDNVANATTGKPVTDIVTPVNTDVVTPKNKSKKRYYKGPKQVVEKAKEVEQVIVADFKKESNTIFSKIKSVYIKFISIFRKK